MSSFSLIYSKNRISEAHISNNLSKTIVKITYCERDMSISLGWLFAHWTRRNKSIMIMGRILILLRRRGTEYYSGNLFSPPARQKKTKKEKEVKVLFFLTGTHVGRALLNNEMKSNFNALSSSWLSPAPPPYIIISIKLVGGALYFLSCCFF